MDVVNVDLKVREDVMKCVAKGGEKKWRGEVGSCGGNVYLYPQI